jgi:hypothetical protein
MLRVAVILLAIGSIFAGAYSLTTVIAPRMMLESTFEAVTGSNLGSVEDADHLKVMLNRHRRAGLYALVSVIFSFFVLFTGFRKAEKWAWWAFLVGGGLAWLWGLIDYIVVGSTMHIVLQAVGTGIFLVGVLLPVGVFFAKAPAEAPPAEESSAEA